MNGNSVPQKLVSNPINLADSHKNLYVGKDIFFGPNIMVSKIKSFIIKHTIPTIIITKIDLSMCHLNSSRCSKKDILSGLFMFTI
tara:strand:- start:245 stop:499 length:255 start_codon:yes stop_codon:yes gene_type:complete